VDIVTLTAQKFDEALTSAVLVFNHEYVAV
jgi:hypothetical protein